jgi:hypothetical protein
LCGADLDQVDLPLTMLTELERLLRDTTLMTVALAVALGWSLRNVGSAAAELITLGLQHTDGGKPPLSWAWGDHVFYYQPLLTNLIVFVVILAVALFVHRRFRSN